MKSSAKSTCGCCEGIGGTTALAIINRPGLDALQYRLGTHATFFDRLLARITTLCTEKAESCREGAHLLRDLLTTRQKSDPAIALFDAWASLADVLTFYQERIANEGYLRTARERRSVEELARLVGYCLRPGVSATAYLAFEVDDALPPAPGSATRASSGTSGDIEIPPGTAVKSTPTPGTDEKPQTFETSRRLVARKEWNAIRLRKDRPTLINSATVADLPFLYFKGTGLRLVPNDYLAIVYDPLQPAQLIQIREVSEDSTTQTTKVAFAADELAPQPLLIELRNSIDAYPLRSRSSQAANAVLTLPFDRPKAVADVYDKLSKTLDDLIASRTTRSNLLAIDTSMGRALLALKDGDPLRESVQAYVESCKKIGDEIGKLLDTTSLSKAYFGGLTAWFTLLEEEDKVLTSLAAMLSGGDDDTNRSRWIANIQSVLASKSFARDFSSNPDLKALGYISGNPAGASQTGKPFENLGVADSDFVGEFTIEIELIRGTTGTATLAFPGFSVTEDVTGRKWTIARNSATAGKVSEIATAAKPFSIGASPRAFQLKLLDKSKNPIATTVQDTDPTSLLTPSSSVVIAAPNQPVAIPLTITASSNAIADAKFCARFTLVPHHKKSSGDLGSIAGDASTFSTETPSASSNVFVFREPTSAPALPFDAFRTLFNGASGTGPFKYDRGTFEGSLSIVVEIFKANDDPKLSLDHFPDDCIATAAVLVLACSADSPMLKTGSGTAEIRVVPQELSRLCDLAGKAATNFNTDVAQPFRDGLWPTGATTPVFGTGELRDKIAALAPSNPTLTTLATLVSQFPLPTADAVWKRRLREFKSDLDATAGLAQNGGIVGASSLKEVLDHAIGETKFIDAGVTVDGRITLLAGDDSTLRALIRQVNNELKQPSLATGVDQTIALLASSQAIDSRRTRLGTAVNEIRAFGTAVDAAVETVGSEIGLALRTRWIAFAKRAQKRIDRLKGAFTEGLPPTTDNEAVGNWLKTLSNCFHATSDLQSAATSLDDLCMKQANYGLAPQVDLITQQIRGIALPAPDSGVPRNLSDALPGINVDQRSMLEALTRSLDLLVARISPNDEPRGNGTPASAVQVSDAVQRVNALQIALGADRAPLLADLLALFDQSSDLVAQVSQRLDPRQRDFLYSLLRSTTAGPPGALEPRVYVFRSRANVFGWNSNSPLSAIVLDRLEKKVTFAAGELAKAVTAVTEVLGASDPAKPGEPEAEAPNVIFLDGSFPRNPAGAVIAIQPRSADPEPFTVSSARIRPRTAYGLRGTTTQLELKLAWWPGGGQVPDGADFADAILTTSVLCDAELLTLANQPLEPVVESSDAFECSELIAGISTGKRVVIEGLPQIEGTQTLLPNRELLEVVEVDQQIDRERFGDSFHTVLRFDRKTQFPYQRGSVRLYANVVDATHGETVHEVLGAGSGANEFQRFTLKRADVSQLPAPTPRGNRAELEVRINDVLWAYADSLIDASSVSQQYVLQNGDDQQSTVVFGDGVNGARVPTGLENVRARYRTGLGIKGNVAAGQINQLVGASLGVKSAQNPLAARGGADPESRNLAREHAPIGILAMDRLVSVQDYVDFVSCFAGIGKASASLLQGAVHVTVAQLTPDPFEVDGPLYLNLKRAIELYGDPSQRFELHNREASLLLLVARVRIDPEREWDKVEPKIRAALLYRFSYDRSDFGADLLLSDAIATIQDVEGVVYADIETFDAVREERLPSATTGSQLANNTGTTLATSNGSHAGTASGQPDSKVPTFRLNPRILLSRERLGPCADRSEAGANEELQNAGVAMGFARLTANGAPPTTNAGFASPSNTPSNRVGRPAPTTTCILPAQLCYLTPDIPDMLLLEQIR